MGRAPPADLELAVKLGRLARGRDNERAPHRYSMWGLVFS